MELCIYLFAGAIVIMGLTINLYKIGRVKRLESQADEFERRISQLEETQPGRN